MDCRPIVCLRSLSLPPLARGGRRGWTVSRRQLSLKSGGNLRFSRGIIGSGSGGVAVERCSINSSVRRTGSNSSSNCCFNSKANGKAKARMSPSAAQRHVAAENLLHLLGDVAFLGKPLAGGARSTTCAISENRPPARLPKATPAHCDRDCRRKSRFQSVAGTTRAPSKWNSPLGWRSSWIIRPRQPISKIAGLPAYGTIGFG